MTRSVTTGRSRSTTLSCVVQPDSSVARSRETAIASFISYSSVRVGLPPPFWNDEAHREFRPLICSTVAAMRLVFLLFALLPSLATAQIYRWIDAAGTVHYSNEAPPADAKATKLDIDARPGPPSADTQEC